MNRAQLEHIIRAAAAIAEDRDIVVVGSQAVLGSHPDAPPELLMSRKADVYPRNSPERAMRVDAGIGKLSLFDETYGYYAHGVGPETARAPAGWEDRWSRSAHLRPAERPAGASRSTTCCCRSAPRDGHATGTSSTRHSITVSPTRTCCSTASPHCR